MGKNLSVRFPDWLYDRLSKDARTNERSVGGQVRYLLGLHYQGRHESHERNYEKDHGQGRPTAGGRDEALV